jgi:hypothetical protein
MARSTTSETEPSSRSTSRAVGEALELQVVQDLADGVPRGSHCAAEGGQGEAGHPCQGGVHSRQVHGKDGGIVAEADSQGFRLLYSA